MGHTQAPQTTVTQKLKLTRRQARRKSQASSMLGHRYHSCRWMQQRSRRWRPKRSVSLFGTIMQVYRTVPADDGSTRPLYHFMGEEEHAARVEAEKAREEMMARARRGERVKVLVGVHEDPHPGVSGYSNTMIHIIHKFIGAIVSGRAFILDWAPPQEERCAPLFSHDSCTPACDWATLRSYRRFLEFIELPTRDFVWMGEDEHPCAPAQGVPCAARRRRAPAHLGFHGRHPLI